MSKEKDKQLIMLGETNFRNQRWRFGIKNDDRRRHMYVVGSTGMGKSEFLKNMAIQDIEAGRGLAFIDPHGDSADALLDYIPKERIKDVVYFDPGDLSFPIAFNVMEKVDFEFRHLVTSGLLGVFKKIFGPDVWSGRMEYILNNTILALLEFPEATLLGINRLLSDKDYRKKVVDNVKDPIVKSFWINEFAKYSERYAQEAVPAIQNKIGQFISNNLIRNIIGQTSSTIDIRKIMDEGKILIVNISRGKIGEDASRLLGALLVTKVQLAAMSRVDIPESERNDFYLYVDEFQHFATESFANILSEARKYHLSLIMAHQYIKQMEEPVMDAVFGNVGTIVSFRVGAEDGEFLEKWFQPDFMMTDIVNLGKFNIYLKLMIDGVSSKGFSAATFPPFTKLEDSNREGIVEASRKIYATPRAIVEDKIAEWTGMKADSTMPDSAPEPAKRDYSRRGPSSYDTPRPRPSFNTVERESRPPMTRSEPQPRREDFRREEPRRMETPRPAPDERPAQPMQPVQTQRPVEFKPRQENPEPRRFEQPASRPSQPPQQPRYQPEPNPQPRTQGLSLNEALRGGPVNFRGRKIEDKKDRVRAEVDTNALRKALEDAMQKKD